MRNNSDANNNLINNAPLDKLKENLSGLDAASDDVFFDALETLNESSTDEHEQDEEFFDALSGDEAQEQISAGKKPAVYLPDFSTISLSQAVKKAAEVAGMLARYGTLTIFGALINGANADDRTEAPPQKTTTTTTTPVPPTTTTTTTPPPTTTTTTTPAPVDIALVYGSMEPCFGGTIDDHMGAHVVLSSVVSITTNFSIQVSYVLPGNTCGVGESTQSFSVTVPAGSTSDNFQACVEGAYFPAGATVCSACILSCDNPAVDLTGATC
jgi:hypothetical protein